MDDYLYSKSSYTKSSVFYLSLYPKFFSPFHLTIPYIIMYLVNSAKALILLHLNKFLSDKKYVKVLVLRCKG